MKNIMNSVRSFTKLDWDNYNGAEDFANGADPVIVDSNKMLDNEITVICCGSGITIDYYCKHADNGEDIEDIDTTWQLDVVFPNQRSAMVFLEGLNFRNDACHFATFMALGFKRL